MSTTTIFVYLYYFLLIIAMAFVIYSRKKSVIKRFWRMKIAPKFGKIGHILVFFFVISLTSCNYDSYNVKLKNGSIVKAYNDINDYKYKSGDTVCIRYHQSIQKWYFDDQMKDTTFTGGGYYGYNKNKTDSSYIPLYFLEYRIGVVK